MRKIVLWFTLLALMLVPSAALGGTTTPLSDFTVHANYRTNDSVYFRDGASPYYGAVTSYDVSNYFFLAKATEKISHDKLPYGTLTVTGEKNPYSGQQYSIRPETTSYGTISADEYVRYVGFPSNLDGDRVMWNIFTSPDLIVGSFYVPLSTDRAKLMAADEIVPYVDFVYSDDKNYVNGFNVYFVKSGDWTTPVKADVSGLTVYGSYFNGTTFGTVSEKNYVSFERRVSYSDSDEEGNRIEEVQNYINASELQNVHIDLNYTKSYERYNWSFQYASKYSNEIDWGDLELSKGPLKISANSQKKITIKFPSSYQLPTEEDTDIYVSTGNSNVLTLDSETVKFTQGSDGTWSGLTYNENKSEMSFTLSSHNPGKTTLRIDLPNSGGGMMSYYREVQVGTVPTSGNNPSDMYVEVTSHRTKSRMLHGKPYYLSSEFRGLDLVVYKDSTPGDEYVDALYDGYFGIQKGNISEIHRLYNLGLGNGVRYSTISKDCEDNIASPIYIEDLSDVYIWWEFPDSSDMNLVSASLKSKMASTVTMKTTAEQLNSFAPYFEVKYDSSNKPVSMDWYFMNPATNAKATVSGVSSVNINVNWNSFVNDSSATSGTISFADTDNISSVYRVYFSYDYGGITYIWEFEGMTSPYNYGVSSSSSIPVGTSANGSLYRYSYYSSSYSSYEDTINSVEAVVRDENIVSVSPTKFTDIADSVLFTITGKKVGTTDVSFVFTTDATSPYDKYRVITNSISVYDPVERKNNLVVTLESGDLSAKFENVSVSTPVIEGRPYYDESTNYFNITLSRDKIVSYDQYYAADNYTALRGTLHVFSGDKEVSSREIYPSYNAVSYIETETGYRQPSYIQVYYSLSVPASTTKITWEFAKDVNKAGQFDLTSIKTKDFSSYKPYVRLNRDGLNLKTVNWYFINSANEKIETPSTVTSAEVYVHTGAYEPGVIYSTTRVLSSDKDAITVNLPEAVVSYIDFNFVDDGIKYNCSFSPIDGPLYSGIDYRKISWDITTDGFPLVLYVGDEKTFSINVASADDMTALVGNSSVASLSSTSSVSNSSMKVTLKGNAAGMTTLTAVYKITSGDINYVGSTYAREIWVAAKNSSTGKYEVPTLTSDLEALMTELTGKTFNYADQYATADTNTQTDGSTGGNTNNLVDNNNVQSEFDTVATEMASPKIDLTNEATKTKIRDLIKNKFAGIMNISSDIEVVSIMSDDSVKIGQLPTADSVSGDVPSGQKAAVVFNRIQVSQPKIFVFNVTTHKLKKGSVLYWLLLKSSYIAKDASVSASGNADEVFVSDIAENTQAIFLDSDVNEITQTAEDYQAFDVAAYIESGDYIPVVTSDAPGTQKGSSLGSSSGGGCDVGFGFMSAALLGFALMLKKK
ncbi:MAG: hypothetical protein IJT20_06575 [Synergistaceae bacterium]|nr:hypothetical protein [Synergistaceae bacterium]